MLTRLRDGIRSGEWKGKLPAERPLSETLQVSRSTLRLAIAQLKSEGWLEVVSKRTVIHHRRSRATSEVMRTRRIVFLTPLPLAQLPPMGLIVYCELSRLLAPLDATIQVETSPAFSHQRVEGFLDRLVADSRADAWVLHRSPPEVQHYFQSRSIPTVIFGNAHKGIEFPSLRVDYPAALSHCLSSLVRLGHERDRVLLLIPDTRLAGHVEIEAAFLEAVNTQAARQVLRYGEEDEAVDHTLSRALSRLPRPTAIIALRTSAAATLQGLLANRFGLSMPGDISIACLEDAPFMSHLVPEITRYQVDVGRVAQFIFSALNRQLSSGIIQAWRHRPLVPELIPGATLGPAREGG